MAIELYKFCMKKFGFSSKAAVENQAEMCFITVNGVACENVEYLVHVGEVVAYHKVVNYLDVENG